ncbi:polyprenol phosphomannose-dependent alpha 1,6 mannosyltransferase MptB [Catenuloplanes japonicus]|uniref:polyprenol phosphomannose-dependent alpha 1,6 mannosyltransferase MptB n=1 Tax=Catenuloplanes japonicus TaxID=33876 RepID=UPI00068BF3E8|nr:polyprenol phosphomannose-dependent alpha 1,6 mannosyltransferase MptB [Catenuloplanes japonicus]
MSSTNAILEKVPVSASPRAPRLATGPVAAVGAVATATLAAVTAGSRLPETAAIAAGLIAMGVVIGAWLFIGRLTASARQLYAVAAAWGAPLLLAPPLFSGDVWSYVAQGATAAAGLDPYKLGPAAALGADSALTQQVSHYWQDTPAPYGPAWMLLSRLAALLTGENLTAGALVYRAIAVAGLVLIAWALPRLAVRAGVAAHTAVWLGLLNPLVLWHLLGGAHNDALMLGLMLAGLEVALAGVDRGTGLTLAGGVVLLTLAAGIKFVAGAAFCVVVIALVHRPSRSLGSGTSLGSGRSSGSSVGDGRSPRLGLFRLGRSFRAGRAPRVDRSFRADRSSRVGVASRRGRSSGSVVAVIIGAFAGTAALSAVAGFGWMTSPLGSLSVYSWMSPTTATGLLIGALFGSDTTPAAVGVLNAIGLVICVPVVIMLLVAMSRRRLDLIRGLGLIFTAALLCGAVVQPWYVLWAVLPLAAAAGTPARRRTVAAVSAVVAVAIPPLTGNAPAMIVGYLIAVAVLGTAALAVRRRVLSTPAPVIPRPRRHAEPAMPPVPSGEAVPPMREHAIRTLLSLPRR